MASIKFDSTELVNSTYIPRFIKHESAPIRELHLLDLAKEDGAVLVSEKYGVKHIVIIGKLTATSRSALDTAIDSFKELFSRKEKDLDVEWETAGTRRYVATCIRHNFDRDHFHNLFVPWSAEFVVAKGTGASTASEQMYNGTITTDTGGGTATASKGSAKPKPNSINLNFVTNTTGKGKRGIAFVCGDKKLIYTQSSVFANGNQFNINVRDKIVKKYVGSWAETSFHGEFPYFDLGNNSFSIEFGEIRIGCGEWTKGGTGQLIHGNNWRGQSFTIPWKDESIMCISVSLAKSGTPPNNVLIRIETDNGGKPSGTLAHVNATISTAPGSLPGVGTGYKYFFANPVVLEANTKYWVVVKTTAGDVSNYYTWLKTTDYYIRGNASASVDAGVNWTDDPDNDYVFEIYVGGKRTSNSNVAIVISHYPRFL